MSDKKYETYDIKVGVIHKCSMGQSGKLICLFQAIEKDRVFEAVAFESVAEEINKLEGESIKINGYWSEFKDRVNFVVTRIRGKETKGKKGKGERDPWWQSEYGGSMYNYIQAIKDQKAHAASKGLLPAWSRREGGGINVQYVPAEYCIDRSIAGTMVVLGPDWRIKRGFKYQLKIDYCMDILGAEEVTRKVKQTFGVQSIEGLAKNFRSITYERYHDFLEKLVQECYVKGSTDNSQAQMGTWEDDTRGVPENSGEREQIPHSAEGATDSGGYNVSLEEGDEPIY